MNFATLMPLLLSILYYVFGYGIALTFFIVLLIIGVIVIILVRLFLVLIPAVIVAAIVYFLTGGDLFWTGIAFVIVALLSLIARI
jgi:hypothetical protein